MAPSNAYTLSETINVDEAMIKYSIVVKVYSQVDTLHMAQPLGTPTTVTTIDRLNSDQQQQTHWSLSPSHRGARSPQRRHGPIRASGPEYSFLCR